MKYIVTPFEVEEVDEVKVEERVNEILEKIFEESSRDYVGCRELYYDSGGVECIIVPGKIEIGETVFEKESRDEIEDEREFLEDIGLDPEDVERIMFIESYDINRGRVPNITSEVIRDWYLIVSRKPPRK